MSMDSKQLYEKSISYLNKLCVEIPERCVGSQGNRMATRFFEEQISSMGWDTDLQEFDAMDWKDGGANLSAEGMDFKVLVSPYSLGCSVESILAGASTIGELAQQEIQGKVVFLYGEIAKEQLMPKNFIFYNPEEHQRIISLLEKGRPEAVICATGRNAALAGGVYPFPLIEDGDFDIPSVYMTEEEGAKFLPHIGNKIRLKSESKRIPGKGYNVIGRKGNQSDKRIVITAHIDAKKGTPGAIDNGTGVVILLLMAQLLADVTGNKTIEIVALNGEDYYAVPGQMLYVSKNQNRFNEIELNINLDGAGYKQGKSAFSFYGLPEEIKQQMKKILSNFNGITEGSQWPQGDHSIFVQNGRPAIAVSSEWFTENIENQTITHTPKDNIDIVDAHKLVEISRALDRIIKESDI